MTPAHSLRALHVIPAVAPRYGGPSRVVSELCRALRTHGVDARIATTDADGDDRLDVPLGSEHEFEGVPTWFFDRQVSESFKYSRPLAAWLDEHVSEFDIAHIHAIYSHSSIAASRACRTHGVPYVLRPLGTLDPWSVSRKALRKRALWYAGVGDLVRGAAAVHYTTEAERRKAESVVGPTPGRVIGLGVDSELFDLEPIREGVPYVLFMSRLHEKKGLDLLIEAFGTATAVDYQEWRLVVAGTGNSEYESRMRELVSRLGLSERVAFVGWASGDRRHELLQSASCFALTSHQENFGLAVAEAMAVGLPVLVSEGVDLAEEVRRGAAGIVTPPQIGAIVDGLRALFEADRTAMGANAQRLARNAFAWDSIAASVVALYRQSTGSLHSPLRAGDTLEVGSVA